MLLAVCTVCTVSSPSCDHLHSWPPAALVQLRLIKFPPTYVERMLAAAVQTQTNQAEESLQVFVTFLCLVFVTFIW